jgi:hypothetical protein
MKALRHLVCGVALVASVGASSASAANWNPVNTTLHGSQVGAFRMTTNLGGVISCGAGTTDLRANSATPSVASTTAASNPLQFSGCTALGFAATVTTHGVWDFTAVNTTTINVTARPSVAGGFVATITTLVPACTVRMDTTSISSTTWHIALGFFTWGHTTTTPITTTTEACGTLFGTSVTFDGTLSFPGASLL